ncbi:MAG: DUF5677 domain-containing protein [Candidatus Shapirobacteria bacterium]
MANIPREIEELKYWTTLLYEILEENKKYIAKKSNDWLIDSEPLVLKVAVHCLSILDLLEGTKPSIPTIKSNINFIDNFSIETIVRSSMETYLVFYYVYLDKLVGKRIRKLRYKIWQASSLAQRQRQAAITTNQLQQLLKKEKSNYLKLRREILNSKSFSKIKLLQMKDFLKKKPFDWKPIEGWRGIAKTSPMTEYFWGDVYNILSSTTHSNAVITNYFQNKNIKDTQERRSLSAVHYLNLIIPLFIEGYSQLFPSVNIYIKKDSNLLLNIKIAKAVVGNYNSIK